MCAEAIHRSIPTDRRAPPDRTCSLHPLAPSGNRPHDALLMSLADSLGRAALAVVLTGSSTDGAGGVAALKAAGATVIAQSEDTAECSEPVRYPEMTDEQFAAAWPAVPGTGE
jgi:chemotaxis response regulator CheB